MESPERDARMDSQGRSEFLATHRKRWRDPTSETNRSTIDVLDESNAASAAAVLIASSLSCDRTYSNGRCAATAMSLVGTDLSIVPGPLQTALVYFASR